VELGFSEKIIAKTPPSLRGLAWKNSKILRALVPRYAGNLPDESAI